MQRHRLACIQTHIVQCNTITHEAMQTSRSYKHGGLQDGGTAAGANPFAVPPLSAGRGGQSALPPPPTLSLMSGSAGSPAASSFTFGPGAAGTGWIAGAMELCLVWLGDIIAMV